MPLFHATLVDRLPSIYRHGLGGGDHKQLWEGAERGVYLATIPEICIWVMIECFMQFASDDSSPKDYFASIRVIVIDDTRYDAQKLEKDPLLEKRDDVFLYRSVINVVGMPVLTVDQVDQVEIPETCDLPRDEGIATGEMMRSIFAAREDNRRDGCLRTIS